MVLSKFVAVHDEFIKALDLGKRADYSKIRTVLLVFVVKLLKIEVQHKKSKVLPVPQYRLRLIPLQKIIHQCQFIILFRLTALQNVPRVILLAEVTDAASDTPPIVS